MYLKQIKGIGKMEQWNEKLYDRNHQFVSNYGKDVVKLLAAKKGEKILDIGCGTGDLANELVKMGVQITGIDRSETMIEEAKKKYPTIPFFVKDILKLNYTSTFDAVFSNAVLHWVKQPKQALEEIYISLKSGGRFVAEFGGKDNVKKISQQIILEREKLNYSAANIDFPWYFPSIGEYTSLMEEVGFIVTYAEYIDRPTRLEGKDGLRNWLHMFSANFFADVSHDDRSTLIQNIETALANVMFKEDYWVADYKRIRVKAVKA